MECIDLETEIIKLDCQIEQVERASVELKNLVEQLLVCQSKYEKKLLTETSNWQKPVGVRLNYQDLCK